ncbi:protein THEMIS3-like [Castor canadensis]|uniref:Protein THEMIS3-like n=1 Tax=Castor canadensis TaxID=51338 RepID=A0AC58MAK6_CASCN
MEQTWNSYINFLNQNSLPRQVEVTDGNYFSGSLQNLSFSKGDIITVIDLLPSHLRAEVNDGEQTLGMIDIPLGYKGKFQLIADPLPFKTVADLVRSVRVARGPSAGRSPSCFQNLVPISIAELPMVLKKRETLSLIDFEENQGRRLLKCEVLRKKPPLTLLLPMDCQGQFQECQDDELYSIDTIVEWKLLAGRKRKIRMGAGHCLTTLSPLIPEYFSGHLVLHPYFSVMALLPGENHITIPSDLDIHVTDITGLGNDNCKTMTMRQIYGMERNKFPLKIKIMSVVIAENKTIPSKPFPLKCGQLLAIFRTEKVRKFIATEISQGKKRRHFLIPCTYQGMVLRRGRYFNFVSDVAEAMQHKQLCFQSSRDYTSPGKPLASFAAKECFLALKKSVVSAKIQGELHRVEVLKCQNIATKAHVKLPLFAKGDFLELIEDAGPGTLQELCQDTRLPCHIRVISPDPSMARDPLYGTEELRVENVVIEQCLIARDETLLDDIYSDWSEDTFAIPVERTDSEVLVVEEHSLMRTLGEDTRVASWNVEEITKAEFLTFSDYLIAPRPPPCLPKPRNLS